MQAISLRKVRPPDGRSNVPAWPLPANWPAGQKATMGVYKRLWASLSVCERHIFPARQVCVWLRNSWQAGNSRKLLSKQRKTAS
jgi:hypothetical protein